MSVSETNNSEKLFLSASALPSCTLIRLICRRRHSERRRQKAIFVLPATESCVLTAAAVHAGPHPLKSPQKSLDYPVYSVSWSISEAGLLFRSKFKIFPHLKHTGRIHFPNCFKLIKTYPNVFQLV